MINVRSRKLSGRLVYRMRRISFSVLQIVYGWISSLSHFSALYAEPWNSDLYTLSSGFMKIMPGLYSLRPIYLAV